MFLENILRLFIVQTKRHQRFLFQKYFIYRMYKFELALKQYATFFFERI